MKRVGPRKITPRLSNKGLKRLYIYELIFQLENTTGLAAFFFDPKCLLAKILAKFLQTVKSYTLDFEAYQARDYAFATKIGYAIDTRIFRWLQLCRDSSDREQVSDSLLDFDDISRDVLLDRYSQSLPSSIKVVEKPTNLGKRKFTEDNNEVMENPSTIKEWLLKTNEDYGKVFAGKFVDKKPKVEGRLLCSRYHTKGYCFPNCKNVATHIPSKKLSSECQKKYSKFFNLCRNEE